MENHRAKIIFIMKEEEYKHFSSIATNLCSDVSLFHIESLESLRELLFRDSPSYEKFRIISFCSSLLVPIDCLKRVSYDAYNIHPGPPSYRGVNPQGFALYNNESVYGVTLHRMDSTVDSGEIVATSYFEIKKDTTRRDLAVKSYMEAAGLFLSYMDELLRLEVPLQANGEIWATRLYKKKDLAMLPSELVYGEDN